MGAADDQNGTAGPIRADWMPLGLFASVGFGRAAGAPFVLGAALAALACRPDGGFRGLGGFGGIGGGLGEGLLLRVGLGPAASRAPRDTP